MRLRCGVINHYYPRDMLTSVWIYFPPFMLELENTVLKELFYTASSKLYSISGFAFIFIPVELGVHLRLHMWWSSVVKNAGSWPLVSTFTFGYPTCWLCAPGHCIHPLVSWGHGRPLLLGLLSVTNERCSTVPGSVQQITGIGTWNIFPTNPIVVPHFTK